MLSGLSAESKKKDNPLRSLRLCGELLLEKQFPLMAVFLPRTGGVQMTRMTKILILSLILILAFPISAFVRPVPDTGQTTCYDGSSEIACPQTGEAFYGQDAQYTINSPSYTKLDTSGNPVPYTATSWAMVRNNITGLIWEVKTENKWLIAD